ncbi:putative nuclease HARBI1 [Helicoverpa armigera]|uniref:putative nuclease HARBI1 n=1 Tax=Helicoverpa armigera TaxID=29058 RepID=UPI003083C64E
MSLSSLSSLSDHEEDFLHHRRRIPDRMDIFSKYDGEDFRIRYRISKHAVLQIRNILDIEPLTERNKPINGLTQLLIFLRFIATGTSQAVLDDLIGIHKSTVCRIIQRVSRKLAELSSAYIKMPNREELREVAEGFFKIGGLPRVAGAVDCTHIKIISRGGVLSEMFRCRKGFFSVNVQVVCDADVKIKDIVARWPGSVHDCTIFNNSHLCADFESGRYGNHYLLGDSGYVNKNFLLVPIAKPQTSAEEAYNKCHIATRSTVERCFGVWKRRCPCLEKGITLNKTSTVLQVIVASAVLHNMCIDLDEMEPPSDIDITMDDIITIPDEPNQTAVSVRTALINSMFS